MSFDEYRELMKEEEEMAKTKQLQQVPVMEVIRDFHNYGNPKTNSLAYVFLRNTDPLTREAVACGRHGMTVYFSTGQLKDDEGLELGLISAHAPGRYIGPGHGCPINRKLGLSKRLYNIRDPEKWLKCSEAIVYESFGGILKGEPLGEKENRFILYDLVDSELEKKGYLR